MKIAIDKKAITGGHAIRGVGAYTKALIKHLKQIKDLEVQAVDLKEADLSGYDLVHYPFFHPFFLTLPFSKKTKIVVTIHDLIPLIYPKHYPPGLRGRFRFLLQKLLVKRADALITVSETSKKDIVRLLGIPSEKISVIYEAPRKIFKPLTDHRSLTTIKKKYHLPDRFVLYVGDVNYNKNINSLAHACKIAKTPLVMVGKQAASKDFDPTHPENRSFAKFLSKYGQERDILRLGFVPDEDLVAIYNLATVYCQPSFYEGFGLPVLEAFACGAPVVIAKTQALVEIADKAALAADPKDPNDIAKKIREFIDSPSLRKKFAKKGLERVKEFSWQLTARKTAEVYKKMIEK